MANLEKGTVVDHRACPHCGTSNPVLLNKNGIAYFYCHGMRQSGDALCSGHVKWGKADSMDMQRAYLANRKAAKAAKPVAAPDPKPMKAPKDEGAENGLFS